MNTRMQLQSKLSKYRSQQDYLAHDYSPDDRFGEELTAQDEFWNIEEDVNELTNKLFEDARSRLPLVAAVYDSLDTELQALEGKHDEQALRLREVYQTIQCDLYEALIAEEIIPLSIADIVEQVEVSPRYIQSEIKAGRLNAELFGGKTLMVTWSNFHKWLDNPLRGKKRGSRKKAKA